MAKSGKKISDLLVAEITIALIQGQMQSDVARAKGVDKATVSRIWKRIPEDLKSRVEQARQDRFGDLLADLLDAQLLTAKEIMLACRNHEWLKKHSPAEIAALFGQTTDKAFLLLQAAAESRGSDVGSGDN